MRQITYHIHRYNEGRSYVQTYTFDYEADRTILWGLQKIKDTIDPSLTFIAACRSAVCGACSVKINGQAMLACESKIDELAERFGSDEFEIAPIGNFDVIRDLAVNWEAKVNRLKTVAPWIFMKPEYTKTTATRQTPEDFKKFVLNTECILCGCCASECNKLSAGREDFLDPYVYTKANRFVKDSRDDAPMAHVNPAFENGLWKCVHCMNCISRCPKHLKPAKDISELRAVATRAGLSNKGTRHAVAFKQDLMKTGRLNEVTMSLKTDGLVDSAKQGLYAMRLWAHGKINPLELIVPHKPVTGIQGVRTIIKAAEEAEKIMKYAFFPGCVLEGAAKEDYVATKAVAKKLGIQIEELDGWTCCGASHVQDIDPLAILATNARNIALAEQQGLDLMTVCNTCTLMLREAKNELDRDEVQKARVNNILAQAGLQYKGTTEVTHFLWILIREYGLNNLKAKVVKPLSGLRVAEYYGCHLLRPQEETGFEDFQIPTSLADVIKAIGATPIDFSRKLDCCGFHAVYPAHDSVMRMTGSINADAAKEGADCVVTPCPLCQMQLDMFQKEAKQYVPSDKDMPIIHMSQLIGLALGISPAELGMTKRHMTSTAALNRFIGA